MSLHTRSRSRDLDAGDGGGGGHGRQPSPVHHELLVLLLEYRFVTTDQLARLTAGHYGSGRSARRQTNRHLAALTHQGQIHCLNRRVGGWQGGSAAAVWTLTTTGHRQLTGSTQRQRPRLLSTGFLAHSLAVTETHVLITEHARATGAVVSAQPEPLCWRSYLDVTGMRVALKPDLAATISTPEFTDRYFIEVDRATENPARVIRKCQQYATYRRLGVEQERHGAFPLVVWIVPTSQRREQLQRHLAEQERLPGHLFQVVTPAEFVPLLQGGPTTSSAIERHG